MKVLHVVGARPNFMKIAPIMEEMARYPDRFQQVLVHTGQHYDDEMSQVFFDDLDIPRPDVYLDAGSGSHKERRSRGAEERRCRGAGVIRSHEELDVYKLAFEAAMRIFEVSKGFPREEVYSLTDQMRRSSRSVCANIAEAWRKRRYEAAFVSKLNDAESELAETQTWICFAVEWGYLTVEVSHVQSG